MNIALTGDIEIIYNFFESNTNMYFDCSSKNKDRIGEKSFKKPSFYEFPKTVSEGGELEPFSPQFEAEAYESLFMIENIGATLNNVETVIYVTIGTLIVVHIVRDLFHKKYSWIKKITNFFHFSYFGLFLLK